MRKRARRVVKLPHLVDHVFLPAYLADAIEIIKRDIGITTEKMRGFGVRNPKQAVYELRKLGAQIETIKRAKLVAGSRKRKIVFGYMYNGWTYTGEAYVLACLADLEVERTDLEEE